MKAMIFAAGLGSRLGEITRTLPKCLVVAGGKTMLEHVVDRLKLAGVNKIIINIFHLGEQIEQFVRSKNSFDIDIQFSKEEELLGTGGGLLKAEWFFQDCSEFIVHNGDIYSEIDLLSVVNEHKRNNPLSTLVVMNRPTSRVLLFDSDLILKGWANRQSMEQEIIDSNSINQEFAFSGIQVISSKIFNYMKNETKNFSTIKVFMNAIKAGAIIRAYIANKQYWIDIGKPDTLEELRRRLSSS